MRVLRSWLPVVLWAAVILSASNDHFSSHETASWLSPFFGEGLYILNVAIRKLAHVVVYAILGALAWRAERRLLIAMVVGALVAITDEAKQSTTLLRSGSPWDVLLDLCGAWLGTLVARRAWKD